MRKDLRRNGILVLALSLIVLALGAFLALGQDRQGLPYGNPTRDQVLRGRYLVTTMACADCHGGMYDPATPGWLAGYNPKTDPEGVFQVGPVKVYAKNLTPDKETGLGRWSPQEIYRALTEGKDDEGHTLCPPMPWPDYRNLTSQDRWAIVAYLISLKPVKNQVPDPVDLRTGKLAHCSFFFQNLKPLTPYPAPSEREVP
jgi:mono/diheme cytochrome c family protein